MFQDDDLTLSQSIGVILGVIAVVAGITYGIWWAFLRLDHIKDMSVRSKEWYRVIYELEDYQTYECHTRYRDVESCSYSGGKRQCTTRQESYRSCGLETHTRTINSWPTQGSFPDKPYWFSPYLIGSGHYERRSENYVIRLSDDKEVWNRSVNSEGQYDAFPVRGKCPVGLNYFNGIVVIGECR